MVVGSSRLPMIARSCGIGSHILSLSLDDVYRPTFPVCIAPTFSVCIAPTYLWARSPSGSAIIIYPSGLRRRW
jgi:hypothetical protein